MASTATSTSAATAGALGSLIGYIGAEVTTEAIFERLLWPQRFYSDLHPRTLISLAVLMPMGGPLHKAALEVLNQIKRKGLYRGQREGDMLGTAFHSEDTATYRRPGRDASSEDTQTRNALPVKALRNLHLQITNSKGNMSDTENSAAIASRKRQPVRRAYRRVHHLTMDLVKDLPDGATVIGYAKPEKFMIGIFTSEVTAIVAAAYAFAKLHILWLGIYFLIPLVLKSIAAAFSVRREDISKPEPGRAEAFEVQDSNIGFSVIEGSPGLVLQFFQHYGHPCRSKGIDRAREIACILIIYAFIAFFPAGLIAILALPPEGQYLWLAYQTYTILMAHIVRLGELEDCGTVETVIARHLKKNKQAFLSVGLQAQYVRFRLDLVKVESVAEGEAEVDRIVGAISERNSAAAESTQ
ncbi:MAG: hypothetical protein M1822_003571 [Bathelium mastoideum]|nr:MAG: hypothetical protein M1822_003571 [Bathelium mastoideum]